MKQKNNQGFSLIEVLVAIVILAAFVVPTCSALVLSARMNAKTQALMQAQLDVSSAVETLMARGITVTIKTGSTKTITINGDFQDAGSEYESLISAYPGLQISNDNNSFSVNVLWVVPPPKEGEPYYTVKAISKDGLVSVETSVRVKYVVEVEDATNE